jgi:ATP-binding cassette subfamily F protein uup
MKKMQATAARTAAALAEAGAGKPKPGSPAPAAKSVKPRKLTGKEQKELDTLPARIEQLETEQAQLTTQLADPAFYKNEAAKFAVVKARLDALEAEHATAFARWEELEGAGQKR